MSTPTEFVLTCGSWQEAQRIVDQLLSLKLVACAEFIPIKSKFTWKQKLEEAEEIKLVMLSLEHLFNEVDTEVAKLHSYETYVLKAMPLSQLSKQATTWLREITDESL